MPVLATTYRLPLNAFRDLNGDPLEGGAGAANGASSSFGLEVGGGSIVEYLNGPSNSGGDIVVTATGYFTMPANYIPGTDFTVSIGALDDGGLSGGELVGKTVGIKVQVVDVDSYDNVGAVLIDSVQPVTDSAYTTYTAATDVSVADLQPGDVIGIRIVVDWPRVTSSSPPIVTSCIVSLD